MSQPSKKKNYGKTNRKAGHDLERFLAKIFRENGYPLCVTARYGSRMHDDAKIDLINIPFNVQAKNGIQRGLNPSKELKAMVTEINKRFPKYSPEHSNINIVIHRKPAQSNKRLPEDTLVIMSLDDFMKLIKISNDSPSE